MHYAHSFTRLSALALGIAGALACGNADAAAFQLKENSAKGLGRAFAGSTSAEGDASVVATNPASMRLLEGTQFQADLAAISFSADLKDYSARHNGPNGPGTGQPVSGGNGGDAGMIAPVPAAYFHRAFGENDNMHFGVSLQVPFGFKTEYDTDWIGRYHGIKTDLKAIDLGASFSYDLNPYVSFGASVFVEHLTIELSSAIDFGTAINGSAQQQAAATVLAAGGTPAQAAQAAQAAAAQMAAMGFTPGAADGRMTISGDNNAFGYVLGGTFSPTDHTHIALSYRSKVEHKITGGDAEFLVPANAAAVLAQSAPGQYVDTDGRATVTLPASATLSVTHAVNDQWKIMADISRTAWSSAFDQVTVDFGSNQADAVLEFGYNDTTFGSIGTEYRMSDTVTLRAGVAYDETPTSYAHRDVRVPDVTRKWLSLGIGWTPSEKVEYNFGYTHLFTNEPAISLVSPTGSTLQGKYDVGGDILAASINYKF
ncbi:membrane protein involved in aromatic hydrocarbon degradation [Pseudoxanthomonas suwonensis 11-1]|uniref:Membrane protein involved in aromatic hydrocarbon degradation n=1 Tax=Pseudoxanthomonas suwonensis (strain 11-1) TaxID=743721 RepID=E6WX71_PSEUU|nr:outer membrane protein transport protein [Pseudoxanthomonas suwonensis]ADV28770.1 membrane protein involved in aromatic hydrocarbon degradation [Pseudoxanthomonas suwonensis 11-1]